MDTKSSIDLPEPSRVQYSSKESAQREWRLLVTFTQFVMGYAFIHKVFIPSILKLTSLSGTPYAHIQYSFLVPLLLAISMLRSDRNTRWISFLCGVTIALGADEIYQTIISRHQGWFAISRLLSSIPLAMAAGFAMSKRVFSRSLVHAWLGAALLFSYVALREFSFEKTGQSQVPKASTPSAVVPNTLNKECGAMELSLKENDSLMNQSTLRISSCGFAPSTLIATKQGIRIKNETEAPVNVHLIYFEKEQKRMGWNLLVPAYSELLGHTISLKENLVAVLYSDSHPQLGIVAISLPFRNGAWKITRKPLSATLIREGK